MKLEKRKIIEYHESDTIRFINVFIKFMIIFAIIFIIIFKFTLIIALSINQLNLKNIMNKKKNQFSTEKILIFFQCPGLVFHNYSSLYYSLIVLIFLSIIKYWIYLNRALWDWSEWKEEGSNLLVYFEDSLPLRTALRMLCLYADNFFSLQFLW